MVLNRLVLLRDRR